MRYVLVHGAWHGSWCWDRVTPLLAAAGHSAEAVDLPGHGEQRLPATQMTMDSYVQAVMDRITAAGDPVILVGHSLGGLFITQVAEVAPESIAALVYLTAFLLDAGDVMTQIVEILGPDAPILSNVVADDSGFLNLDGSVAADLFYGMCTDADAAHAASRLVPESGVAVSSPLELTAERAGRVPRYYVHCRQDRAIPPPAQELMVLRHPCRQVFTLDADHSPFLCQPAELAEILLAVAEDQTP
jgi:pimeloyl-ACP methyl ester carboxylesterase